jgi:hypothetical protein
MIECQIEPINHNNNRKFSFHFSKDDDIIFSIILCIQ